MLKLRMLLSIAVVAGVVFAFAVPSFAGRGGWFNGISINGISINGIKPSNAANLNGLQASGKTLHGNGNATLNDLSKGGLAKKN